MLQSHTGNTDLYSFPLFIITVAPSDINIAFEFSPFMYSVLMFLDELVRILT